MALVGELLSPLSLLVSLKPSSSSSLKISDSFTEVEAGCRLASSVLGRLLTSEEEQSGVTLDKLYVPLLWLPSSESGPGLGFTVWVERSPRGCLHRQEALEEPANEGADGG